MITAFRSEYDHNPTSALTNSGFQYVTYTAFNKANNIVGSTGKDD
jgi:hypothetical protein